MVHWARLRFEESMRAARRGDLAAIRRNERLVEINLRDPMSGLTVLHCAAQNGHSNIVRYLLKVHRNIDLNIKDHWGKVPLHLAASRGHAEVVNLLIRDPRTEQDICDAAWRTSLHASALFRHLNIVTVLLENGAKIDSVDNQGRTPLHYAAEKGYNVIVKELINKGCDINIKDQRGSTALDLALERDHLLVSETFASLKLSQDEIFEHFRGRLGSVCDLKCFNVAELIIERLLELNRNENDPSITTINVPDNLPDNVQALVLNHFRENLHSICIQNHFHIAKILLRRMSPRDISDKLKEKPHTALWHACKNGHLKMVELLMDKAPYLRYKKAPDETYPQDIAFFKDQRNILDYLERQHGIAVEIPDPKLPVEERKADTLMTNLTFKYPVFNDQVGCKSKTRQVIPKKLDPKKMDKLFLKDFCAVKSFGEGSEQGIVYIRHMEIRECESECEKYTRTEVPGFTESLEAPGYSFKVK